MTDSQYIPSSGDPRTELERAAWPVLSDAVIDALRAAGTVRDVSEGDVFFEVGQESYDLIHVETGSVRIVERETGRVVTRITSGNFVGELGLLMGQGTFLAGEADEDGRVIVVSQDRLREIVASVPEVADVVVSAFAARRRLLLEWRQGGLTVVGREGDRRTTELLEFASRNSIPHRFVDRADDVELARVAAECDLPAEGVAVVTGRSEVLTNPSKRALADALGLRFSIPEGKTFDLCVVGAGPGGLAAAVYGASEGLSTVVVEDTAIGGQAGTSSRIENYLGFSLGISGGELAYQGTIQAVKFGATLAAPRRAVALTEGRCGAGDRCLDLKLDDGTRIQARSVILANGVQYRRLPLDRLEAFEGAGIYYAATELEARFCRDTDAVIVGGGNSAGQAAMFLSQHAIYTHVVVRSGGLSDTMSSYLSGRLESDPRIDIVPRSEVAALHGGERLEAVTLRDRDTGVERRIETRALFIMIGAVPYTDWLDGTLELDEKGFVKTGVAAGQENLFATTLPGVFAVGDIRAGSVKRVASAVGEGSVAVSGVHAFLLAKRLGEASIGEDGEAARMP
ncbi:MAG: FAD-dependent oxidoreductase [Pseudomonadota bacterium]